MTFAATARTFASRGTHLRTPVRTRRGIATLWTILFTPILLILLFITVEVGNMWLARVELENGLEAAALAAVKEWGDANGGDTYIPREVGVIYAASNMIGGDMPLVITHNYDASKPPNQNADCEGNLIFGAVEEGIRHYIFNAGIQPGCGAGTVLFDATGQGKGGLEADDAWGIAFHITEETPPNMRITRVIINLQGSGADGVFDFESSKGKNGAKGPTISDLSDEKVHDRTPNTGLYSQPDLEGFPNPQEQILFTPTVGSISPTLTIDFFPDPDGDDLGFEPGDRFRFGARVDNVSKGIGNNDGDGIGLDGATVTVFFSIGDKELPPVSGVFFDNDHAFNDSPLEATVEPLSGSLIVHETGIADLPQPDSSAGGGGNNDKNNNGQSFVLLQGSGTNAFAVRAQARVQVNSPLCYFFGLLAGDSGREWFTVTAKTTAIYDCTERRPELVRIEKFICPGPDENGGSDPGGSDPGSGDPGGTDPGGTDPGGTDPGDTDPPDNGNGNGGGNNGGGNNGGGNNGGGNDGGNNGGGNNGGGNDGGNNGNGGGKNK